MMTIPENPAILAVDDTLDNLLLLEAVLGEPGPYRLTCVESGEGALQAVEESTPDLILLDVMMPGMSGYEVARRIRQAENMSYIPILLLTADQRVTEGMGTEAGADGLIHKPFDINDLVARIRSLLPKQPLSGVCLREKCTHRSNIGQISH